ncbi:MAG: HNH endonuclease [Leptospiraceae bacterium]|nr:HNH endonuclease [Leptospiraceae bacterium]MCP5513256.1 HNH endonuclease [Leptospiraceae bacterium]
MDKLLRPVLVLNSSYVPISIRNVKDAICMLILEKAQTIKSLDNDFIRSERLRIPIPSIILLSNYFLVPRRSLKPSRNGILERDNYTCVYCGKKPGGSKLTMDHIVPRSRWLTTPSRLKPSEFNSWENLVTACKDCNSIKGSKLLNELGWKSPDSFKLRPKKTSFLHVNLSLAEKYGWSEYLIQGK